MNAQPAPAWLQRIQAVRCPACQAHPGEACSMKGRRARAYHHDRKRAARDAARTTTGQETAMPDQTTTVVHIAHCPTHGLHGARERCFVCEQPVDQIAMVPAEALEEALALLARITSGSRKVHPGREARDYGFVDEATHQRAMDLLRARAAEAQERGEQA